MNCKGPCLIHCYRNDTIIILILGILIGYFFGKRNKKNLN